MIYMIRGQKVMLDSDLAELYGVEVKRLNEQVKRNIERFPEDFMFECNFEDIEHLRSQIATANHLTHWNHKRRTDPLAFTELGVAMLSSVLNGSQAISVNISIMRAFVRLRSFLVMESTLAHKVDRLEKNTNRIFKVVFERLDDLEGDLPVLPKDRKKIGLKPENKKTK